MNRHLRTLAVLACALWSGCRCGSADPAPIARIDRAEGGVERSASLDAPWTAAAVGDELRLNAGVRTDTASSADVRMLAGGATLRLGELSSVRFATSAREDLVVDLRAGNAEIEAGSVELVIATERGPARLRAGSRATLEATDDGTHIEIIVGTATIEPEGGPAIEIGPALVEPADDAGPGDDTVRIELPGGEIASKRASAADLTMPAGESATIHAPAPPVAVRVQFGDACADLGLLELSEQRSFRAPAESIVGRENAVAELQRGTHHYRLRCTDGKTADAEPAATGRVRVVRDVGRKPVSRRTPHNEVDADGRSYSVLYQGREPKLTFRWSRASESDGYVLHIEDARGRERTFRRKTPAVTLRSGALGEGRYRWWIETAGPGKRKSPVSKLRIEFDNAATRASVSRPRVGADWRDEAVAVRGTAIPGSRVSAAGVDLPLDRHARFSARISPPDGGDAFAIRIEHPRGGVHYYVRRRGRR